MIPKQLAISRAFEAFDEEGNLRDEPQQATVLGIGRTVAEYADKLKK